MDWQKRWGDKYDFLVEQHELNKDTVPGWKTPTAISEKPELDVIDIPYLKAFHTLTGSRQSGMGVGAIQLDQIEAYIRLLGVPNFFDSHHENVEAFVKIITRVDNHYLSEHYKEQEKKSKASSKGKK